MPAAARPGWAAPWRMARIRASPPFQARPAADDLPGDAGRPRLLPEALPAGWPPLPAARIAPSRKGPGRARPRAAPAGARRPDARADRLGPCRSGLESDGESRADAHA